MDSESKRPPLWTEAEVSLRRPSPFPRATLQHPGGVTIVLMPGHLDGAELNFIFLLAIVLFGDKLGGKSWQEMAEQFAYEIQHLRGRVRIDPSTVRDLTVLGIVFLVLVLELSWLATQI